MNTLLVSGYENEYYLFLKDPSIQALLQLDSLYNIIMQML